MPSIDKLISREVMGRNSQWNTTDPVELTTWLRGAIVLAILLMPLSPVVKDMLGMQSVTWVNPALLLCAFILLYFRPVIEPVSTLLVVLVALISGALGGLLWEPWGLYSALREPIRLAMGLIWFLIAKTAWERAPNLVEKTLVVVVLLEFAAAVYVWLALAGYAPALFLDATFIEEYRFKQLMMFGDVAFQRLLGTFFEGPPFGLFMFCALVVFTLRARQARNTSRWRQVGIVVALVGVVGSVSDQVLLGAFLFVLAFTFIAARQLARPWMIVGAVIAIACAAGLGVTDRLQAKFDQIGMVDESDAAGLSGAGRAFHIQTGVTFWLSNPFTALIGIGPGRYGELLAERGTWPGSTTMQVTVAEWFVEYGVIGAAIILFWLAAVGKRAWSVHGLLGIAALGSLIVANGFQASWKSEAWFFALAFLAAGSLRSAQSETELRSSLKSARTPRGESASVRSPPSARAAE